MQCKQRKQRELRNQRELSPSPALTPARRLDVKRPPRGGRARREHPPSLTDFRGSATAEAGARYRPRLSLFFPTGPSLRSPEKREGPGLQGLPRWARLGSNQRPPACEAGALPLSYAPQGEDRLATRTWSRAHHLDLRPRGPVSTQSETEKSAPGESGEPHRPRVHLSRPVALSGELAVP
jgi:hypothetical protein